MKRASCPTGWAWNTRYLACKTKRGHILQRQQPYEKKSACRNCNGKHTSRATNPQFAYCRRWFICNRSIHYFYNRRLIILKPNYSCHRERYRLEKRIVRFRPRETTAGKPHTMTIKRPGEYFIRYSKQRFPRAARFPRFQTCSDHRTPNRLALRIQGIEQPGRFCRLQSSQPSASIQGRLHALSFYPRHFS